MTDAPGLVSRQFRATSVNASNATELSLHQDLVLDEAEKQLNKAVVDSRVHDNGNDNDNDNDDTGRANDNMNQVQGQAQVQSQVQVQEQAQVQEQEQKAKREETREDESKAMEGSKFAFKLPSLLLTGGNSNKAKAIPPASSPEVVMSMINLSQKPSRRSVDDEMDRERSPISITMTYTQERNPEHNYSQTKTANTNSVRTRHHSQSKTQSRNHSDSRSETHHSNNNNNNKPHDVFHANANNDEHNMAVVVAGDDVDQHARNNRGPPQAAFVNTLEVVDEEDDITIIESTSIQL
ncbi:SAP DNA-binding domain-containing protein [Reticulomyxa filosa]|uniref:SAP DNA-binding domain-containing protein n=1 Tax=Reticulomyxa filosa TaxID=46433 RepID=X6NCL3_RETFI|nr:SAP DNA-binding domain-containing protein [Reticulomyxa filosa]|eukprot:ETO24050.1 SAP DNA-binding domain-containing protein [Reticulomyxa filosa]